MFLIDSHCHIDKLFDKLLFKNIYDFINFLKNNNIKYILCICTDIKNFFSILSLTSYVDYNIKLSCGIHPLYIKKNNSNDFFYLKKFLKHEKIVAIGECGLDYKNINNYFKKLQIFFFEKHLFYSIKYNKTCIIHSRFSGNDTYKIIKNFSKNNNFRGLIHSYSYENKKLLYNFLDLGLYISLSGLITFNNMKFLEEIIKILPLDRLLVETDSPYLCPKYYNFKYNDPSKIVFIIKKISIIKKKSFYEILKYSINNFFKLFKF